MIHAVVHTQGVVLHRTYVPLELAYRDALGVEAHFLITSPISFSSMRKHYPHSRPDVVVVTDGGGTPYSSVLDFLKFRYACLANVFPRVVFGYKGNSFQPQVLKDAGIPDAVNVERLGVPALRRHGTTTDDTCRWHCTGRRRKCALDALNQILLSP